MNIRSIPTAKESEDALLCCMMLETSIIPDVRADVSAGDFSSEQNGRLFNVICELDDNQQSIDLITIAQVGTDKYGEGFNSVNVSDIMFVTPSSDMWETYMGLVLDKSVNKRFINLLEDKLDRAYQGDKKAEDEIDDTEARIIELSRGKSTEAIQLISEVADSAFFTIEKLKNKEIAELGIPSGYTDLDVMTSGFVPTDLLIVAGRPSMGKTAFVLNCMYNQALDNIPVGIFSLEMSKDQLYQRLLSMSSKVNLLRLRKGNVSNDEWADVAAAHREVRDLPIHIDGNPFLNEVQFRSRARRMVQTHGVKAIYLDYLQLMDSTSGDGRNQEITKISRMVKAVAREQDVPIIAISQLSRAVEQRDGKRPQLSDLRESGAIEQDADVVMFIYRPEYYGIQTLDNGASTLNRAEIIIGKQRNGPTGDVPLVYQKKYARFLSLAPNDFGRNTDSPEPGEDDFPF